jgi:hypothetical protein
MSKFVELRRNPVKNNIIGTPKKVLISLVSCMCDNKNEMVLEGDSEGCYSLNTCGSAYSNFQLEHSRNDVIWEAESGNWDKVIKMLNSGTSAIESIRVR